MNIQQNNAIIVLSPNVRSRQTQIFRKLSLGGEPLVGRDHKAGRERVMYGQV